MAYQLIRYQLFVRRSAVGARSANQSASVFSLSALVTTLTDDSAIAAAATIGDSVRPNAG